MNKTIGIAGLGWLGLPLAQRLQFLGYTIKGTVTKLEKATALQQSGINAYPLTLSETGLKGSPDAFLKNLDILVIMIPPGLRRGTGADYVLKMTHFLQTIEGAKVSKCMLISSTSVYGDAQGVVTEADTPKPETEAGRQLLQVEQLFFTAAFKTTIVRFGGLIGGSRQPVRYLAGRENLSNGKAPVNLIHREDCIGIITAIIQQDCFGHIFNAVHPDHPSKAIYYPKVAKALGLQPPKYTIEETVSFKEVNSVNLLAILDYHFKKEL